MPLRGVGQPAPKSGGKQGDEGRDSSQQANLATGQAALFIEKNKEGE